MPRMLLLAAMLLFVVVPAPCNADAALSEAQRLEILAEAQQRYDEAVNLRRKDPQAAADAFAASAARFKQLVDDGVVNGRLEYNLANAHLQAGELAPAILHYRRAQRLIGGDARLQHNLDYARSLCRNRIPQSGQRALAAALLSWHWRTGVRTRAATFAVAYLAFWIILAARLLWPRSAWWWIAGLLAVIWLATGVSVAVENVFENGGRDGVVLNDDVTIRKGNGEGFDPKFQEPLYQGVEFSLVDQRPGWMNIELADGKTGWIRASDAALID